MAKKELDLMTRRKLLVCYRRRYREAKSKKEKSQILDEFVSLTQYNRSYASWLLRRSEGPPRPKAKRKRPRIYDDKVLRGLLKIWAILDFPSGLRLKAMLPKLIPKLEKMGEISLDEQTREKLHRISRSTIERLLGPEREGMNLKSRARTKPGSLLKGQIPIRTHGDWEEQQPGFLEIDLLGHDGGLARGDYCWSLVLTDIKTQWTELVPIRNRAQIWTFEALKEAIGRFPFPIRGIDSDNDGAFINHHLLKWCKEKGVVFTRSRPYRKNDSCHVEQKNWTVGRRYLGYLRYETQEALEVLRELEELLGLYVNYFQPSVKLVSKTRVGSRVKRIYDEPQTPCERVLKEADVPPEVKERLQRIYEELNPAELRRRILKLQERLLSLATPVRRRVGHE